MEFHLFLFNFYFILLYIFFKRKKKFFCEFLYNMEFVPVKRKRFHPNIECEGQKSMKCLQDTDTTT